MSAPFITLLCWIIFILYWIVNWWRVKPAEETTWRSPQSRWTIAWILILLFIIARSSLLPFFPSLNCPPYCQQDLFTPSFHLPFLQPIGVVVTIVGLIIAIIARKTLADNWSSNIELKKNHKLITTGIYKYARHPIYTGISVMGFGAILTLQAVMPILFFISMFVFFLFKMNKEEALLTKHFPKEYTAYKKKTKALIPFIF